MGFKLELELDRDFEREFKKYKRKFPKLVELEGLNDENLDPMRLYKSYIHRNIGQPQFKHHQH